jgi:hypothetical protein
MLGRESGADCTRAAPSPLQYTASMARPRVRLPPIAALCAAACGPVPDADTTSGAQMMATDATDASTTTRGSSGVAGSSEAGGAMSTGSDAATGVGESHGEGGDGSIKLDLPAPHAMVCPATEPATIALAITTPAGSWVATQAWWAWEWCCVSDPWLVLAPGELEVPDTYQITPPYLGVRVRGTWEHTGAYEGSWPAGFEFAGEGVAEEIEGSVVIDTPVDPDDPDASATMLQVSFALDKSQWQIVGSVAAPYCAAIEVPACPCE